MSFFCKKYSVCVECGVHFEPYNDGDMNFTGYCTTHRKPLLDLLNRKRLVLEWAESRWEKLEKQAKKELAEEFKNSKTIYSSDLGMAQTQAQAYKKYTGRYANVAEGQSIL